MDDFNMGNLLKPTRNDNTEYRDNASARSIEADLLGSLCKSFRSFKAESPKYDGKSNIKQFLIDFERYLEFIAVEEDAEMAALLYSALTGDALAWARLLPSEETKSYMILKDLLKSEFSPDNFQKATKRGLLYGTTQKDGESFRSFLRRLQTMAKESMDRETMTERELVTIACKGANPQLQNILLGQNFSTIEELKQIPAISDPSLERRLTESSSNALFVNSLTNLVDETSKSLNDQMLAIGKKLDVLTLQPSNLAPSIDRTSHLTMHAGLPVNYMQRTNGGCSKR